MSSFTIPGIAIRHYFSPRFWRGFLQYSAMAVETRTPTGMFSCAARILAVRQRSLETVIEVFFVSSIAVL